MDQPDVFGAGSRLHGAAMTAADYPSSKSGFTSSSQWVGSWLERMESLIERYPWPTLLLALSVGYVISRRMR
jgi:hypothetical protein